MDQIVTKGLVLLRKVLRLLTLMNKGVKKTQELIVVINRTSESLNAAFYS